MRLDHYALRVADRAKTVDFITKAFGYEVAEHFTIDFEDGSCANCTALRPPESEHLEESRLPRHVDLPFGGSPDPIRLLGQLKSVEMHAAPEIFVSEGTPGSIVANWVAERGGVGGLHHVAHEVDDVRAVMRRWTEDGLAEFTTAEPIENSSNLSQCFTKPHPLTGLVYEFIHRGRDNKGFNVDSVRDLMKSTV